MRSAKSGFSRSAIAYATAGALFVVALAVLARTVSFLSDDWCVIDRGALPAGAFVTNMDGQSGAGGFYRPLVSLTFAADRRLGGGRPAAYHVTNVLLHALAAGLVFLLCRELAPGGSRRVRYAAAALFLVLPVHTDTVYWVAARTDSLCAVFFFLSLLSFVRFVARPAAGTLAVSLLGLAGALLSKEMAWTLPGLFVLVVLLRGAWRDRRVLGALAAAGVLYAAYFAVRWAVLGSLFGSVANAALLSAGRIPRALFDAGAVFSSSGAPRTAVTLIVWGVTALLGVYALGRADLRRDIVLLAGLFLLSLVPVLGLMTRWYLYIPSAFACMAVARLWTDAPRGLSSARLGFALLAALTVYFGAELVRESAGWRRASALSGQALDAAAAQLETGRPVFVMNLPATVRRPDDIGEKPVFAYGFDRALRQRMGAAADAVRIVNYVTVVDTGAEASTLVRTGPCGFDIACEPPSAFCFHTHEFAELRGRSTGSVRRSWGTLALRDPQTLGVRIDDCGAASALFFDGRDWRTP